MNPDILADRRDKRNRLSKKDDHLSNKGSISTSKYRYPFCESAMRSVSRSISKSISKFKRSASESKAENKIQDIVEDVVEDVHYEGFLEKRALKGTYVKNWKRRYFRLDNDSLTYYKDKTDTNSKGEIPIDGTTVVAASTTHKFGFVLTTLDLTVFLSADNEREKDQWIYYIDLAATRVRSKQEQKSEDDTPQTRAEIQAELVKERRIKKNIEERISQVQEEINKLHQLHPDIPPLPPTEDELPPPPPDM